MARSTIGLIITLIGAILIVLPLILDGVQLSQIPGNILLGFGVATALLGAKEPRHQHPCGRFSDDPIEPGPNLFRRHTTQDDTKPKQ